MCHIFHFSFRVTEDMRVPGETGDFQVWGSKVTRWTYPPLQNINLKPFYSLFLPVFYFSMCILCKAAEYQEKCNINTIIIIIILIIIIIMILSKKIICRYSTFYYTCIHLHLIYSDRRSLLNVFPDWLMSSCNVLSGQSGAAWDSWSPRGYWCGSSGRKGENKHIFTFEFTSSPTDYGVIWFIYIFTGWSGSSGTCRPQRTPWCWIIRAKGKTCLRKRWADSNCDWLWLIVLQIVWHILITQMCPWKTGGLSVRRLFASVCHSIMEATMTLVQFKDSITAFSVCSSQKTQKLKKKKKRIFCRIFSCWFLPFWVKVFHFFIHSRRFVIFRLNDLVCVFCSPYDPITLM